VGGERRRGAARGHGGRRNEYGPVHREPSHSGGTAKGPVGGPGAIVWDSASCLLLLGWSARRDRSRFLARRAQWPVGAWSYRPTGLLGVRAAHPRVTSHARAARPGGAVMGAPSPSTGVPWPLPLSRTEEGEGELCMFAAATAGTGGACGFVVAEPRSEHPARGGRRQDRRCGQGWSAQTSGAGGRLPGGKPGSAYALGRSRGESQRRGRRGYTAPGAGRVRAWPRKPGRRGRDGRRGRSAQRGPGTGTPAGGAGAAKGVARRHPGRDAAEGPAWAVEGNRDSSEGRVQRPQVLFRRDERLWFFLLFVCFFFFFCFLCVFFLFCSVFLGVVFG